MSRNKPRDFGLWVFFNTEGTEGTDLMSQSQAQINELTGAVIGAAIEVHRSLGPGLLESTYEACLPHELSLRSIRFERQLELPVTYKAVTLECGYRIDLLVEGQVILELKAVERVLPIHEQQLLSYLKLSDKRVGLLINFNVEALKNGVSRIINGKLSP